MALLHPHHDDVLGNPAAHPLWSRALKRIGAHVRWAHHAIVRAKLGRLHRELMFRRDYDELLPPEQDVKQFPQRPAILGDKWDF